MAVVEPELGGADEDGPIVRMTAADDMTGRGVSGRVVGRGEVSTLKVGQGIGEASGFEELCHLRYLCVRKEIFWESKRSEKS